MRSLLELTQTDDPALTELREWVAAAPTANRLLAPDASLAEQALLQLQVTRQAMLGAQVFDTGGISAFGGRIRLRGSPSVADAPLSASLLQAVRLSATAKPKAVHCRPDNQRQLAAPAAGFEREDMVHPPSGRNGLAAMPATLQSAAAPAASILACPTRHASRR